MKKFLSTVFLFAFCLNSFAKDRNIQLTSPDKNITINIVAGNTITYQVLYKNQAVTMFNTLSLNLEDGSLLGVNSQLKNVQQHSVNEDVKPLYGMAAIYHNNYNEAVINFKENFSVAFRVFNNGVAYRFITSISGSIKVKEENVEYKFDADVNASMMKIGNFLTSYEEHYIDDHISFLDSNKKAAVPLVAESKGIKIGITESDLLDYPGIYFTYDGSNGLKAVFPKFVSKDSVGGCCPNFEKLPIERADYIAETNGTRSFPWRLMIIVEKDKDLLYNNLVYLLATPSKIADESWIKPGKVAWDWWNANNLSSVSFKTGFNTNTYKYFIDFAAANGIEYINMDEGWSDQFDLLKLNNGDVKISTNGENNKVGVSDGLDMNYLFNYAKEKNVGIILWCVWHTLERQMDTALAQFEKRGVKGLKVDFMDRDDQTVVNFYERLAKEAAKRKMLVNFHGAFKATGLQRTYPNIINREAVQGLEYNKFSDKCTPEHLAHIPFIRMLAGSMDYTPGGLYNVNEQNFRVVNEQPMTQGTRCQQLALYTILYAPLEMLSDAPTSYEKQPDILKYIAGMPTVWDETIALDGKLGDYAVLARRKNNNWYVAGITDWTQRSINLKFDFLPAGNYDAEIFTDGANANRVGTDYIRVIKNISTSDSLNIEMMKGGGFAIKLTRVQ